jgi:hypothetical protein
MATARLVAVLLTAIAEGGFVFGWAEGGMEGGGYHPTKSYIRV